MIRSSCGRSTVNSPRIAVSRMSSTAALRKYTAAIQCRNAAVGTDAARASESKNVARSSCSTMPRTVGCCVIFVLIQFPTEGMDHTLDRHLPGDLSQSVQAHIAPDAKVHAILMFDRRGARVATLQ